MSQTRYTIDEKEAIKMGCTGAWIIFIISLFVNGFHKESIINGVLLAIPITYVLVRVIQFISQNAFFSITGSIIKGLLILLLFGSWITIAIHSNQYFWQWKLLTGIFEFF